MDLAGFWSSERSQRDRGWIFQRESGVPPPQSGFLPAAVLPPGVSPLGLTSSGHSPPFRERNVRGEARMIDTHWCTHCWQWLPTDHFRPNDRLRSGVHSYCRVCAADLARDWRERNPVAIERYNRERREAYAEARGSLERVCVNPDCGGTFTPARVDAKTCSKECRDRLAYLRRRGRLVERLPSQ